MGEGGKPLDRELALKRMRTHIGTVVGHYKDRVRLWEVWNEPDLDGFFAGKDQRQGMAAAGEGGAGPDLLAMADHFGAVAGIGEVAVGREQVGHAADFAPAHGVGLACQREGTCAGAADLLRGQVQVDERRVFGRAVAGLVQALAIQAQCGAGCGE